MTPERLLLLLAAAAGVLLVSLSAGAQAGNKAGTATAEVAEPRSLQDASGASRCQTCHAAEVQGYAQSAMAHSLRRAGHEPSGTVETGDGKVTMRRTATGYWQRLETGSDTTDYRIDYVIGSGNHASGYLFNLAGHLFQSPVAYYKSRQAYDLAPGYESAPHPDFTRPIAEACLFCHSGTALKISGTSNLYQSPPFSAEAITCERCHGPAEKHLEDPRAGTIVNPRKLEPSARDSICEQCHLLGVGRVLNPGKAFADFRPGERLEQVFTTYSNVSPPGADGEKFKVISHVEQLARSVCARKSNGQLWCGTCHDPHSKPAEPVQFFRTKCLSCHAQSFPSSHPDKSSNCIGCHMPRRDARDGGHTAFTDHRIQRRPGAEQALPPDADIRAWREPAPEFEKRNLGIAYINAGMERRSRDFIGRGYRLLTEVQQQFADDSEIFTSLGSALLVANQTSEAELAFERALQLDPASATAETNAASAYMQAGDVDRAVAHLERAVAIDPLNLAADAPLIELYRQQGKATEAAELASKLSTAMEQQGANREAPSMPEDAASAGAAETVFKNIQVLKGIPSDQVVPAMRLITASLGVGCSYCHVPDHFDRDDKKPKQTARKMMQMMALIDNKNFAGYRAVTCYSCHRGSPKPEGTPLIASDAGPAPTAGSSSLVAPLPTADEVITKYIRAVGGVEAIEKIFSREETGKTIRGGGSFRLEAFYRDPKMHAMIVHVSDGARVNVIKGDQGWSSSPGHGVEVIGADELAAARMDADLHFPLHLRQNFAELRVEYPEKVGERETLVIAGANFGKPPVRLYFDEQSGLLVRLVRYEKSPLGLAPTQIDYGDYREVDGIRIPFRRAVAQPDGHSVTQIEQVRQNILINNAMFRKPVSAAGSKPSER